MRVRNDNQKSLEEVFTGGPTSEREFDAITIALMRSEIRTMVRMCRFLRIDPWLVVTEEMQLVHDGYDPDVAEKMAILLGLEKANRDTKEMRGMLATPGYRNKILDWIDREQD